MKKLSFEKGAFIATFCIFLSKILGLLYVIPIYAIIGEQSGALYSDAYIIDAIFLSICSGYLPLISYALNISLFISFTISIFPP